MGIADKVRREDQTAKRSTAIRWVVMSVVSLALFLLVLFYFWLPAWRGPQP